MSDERRRFERSEANCSVEIAMPKGQRRVRDGQLGELSLGGGLLRIDESCPVGTSLSIRIWFPDLSDMVCQAVVRNERERGRLGVEFVDISPQDWERLTDFLENPPRSRWNPPR